MSRQVMCNGQSSKSYPTLIAKPQPAHFVAWLHYFQATHGQQCAGRATQVNFNVSGHCVRTIMCTMNFVLKKAADDRSPTSWENKLHLVNITSCIEHEMSISKASITCYSGCSTLLLVTLTQLLNCIPRLFTAKIRKSDFMLKMVSVLNEIKTALTQYFCMLNHQ